MEVVSKCQYCNLGCVSYRISFIFFANYILFRLRNTPTKFREAPPSHCKVICCIENRGGDQHGHFWCVFYRISLVFFDKYNLFRLRNTPTKFREAALCICGVMWKLCQNDSIAI